MLALYLHGSQVRGKARADSDVDVAVSLLPGRADADLTPLAQQLATDWAIGHDLLDLKVMNAAPVAFQFRVLRDRRLLWTTDHYARALYETRVMQEYHDFKYFEDMYIAARQERLRAGTFGRRPPLRTARSR